MKEIINDINNCGGSSKEEEKEKKNSSSIEKKKKTRYTEKRTFPPTPFFLKKKNETGNEESFGGKEDVVVTTLDANPRNPHTFLALGFIRPRGYEGSCVHSTFPDNHATDDLEHPTDPQIPDAVFCVCVGDGWRGFREQCRTGGGHILGH